MSALILCLTYHNIIIIKLKKYQRAGWHNISTFRTFRTFLNTLCACSLTTVYLYVCNWGQRTHTLALALSVVFFAIQRDSHWPHTGHTLSSINYPSLGVRNLQKNRTTPLILCRCQGRTSHVYECMYL